MVIAAATNRKEASSEYDFTRKDMQEYIKQVAMVKGGVKRKEADSQKM